MGIPRWLSEIRAIFSAKIHMFKSWKSRFFVDVSFWCRGAFQDTSISKIAGPYLKAMALGWVSNCRSRWALSNGVLKVAVRLTYGRFMPWKPTNLARLQKRRVRVFLSNVLGAHGTHGLMGTHGALVDPHDFLDHIALFGNQIRC